MYVGGKGGVSECLSVCLRKKAGVSCLRIYVIRCVLYCSPVAIEWDLRKVC